MNGQLAALMALALHGNAWLAAPEGPPPALLETNSTFRFVRSLRIVDRSGRWRAREVEFADTATWLEHLRTQRIDRLTLIDAHATGPLPDEVAASFANGIRWGVQRELPIELIRYGDPDGQGDLKRKNQIALRLEIVYGWYVFADRFAVVEDAGS